MAAASHPAWPLHGHSDAEAAFLDAATSGRLHHAWLMEGPSGIGKAQLARRLAGYLLGARGPEARPLDAPEDDPVVRLIQSGAHPDLRWIARTPDDKGKLPQDIKVDQIRDLIHFFTLAPAMGGYRVGVIDAMDEVNRSGANAVLKTLEEPPARAVLFLIYHGTAPILPTVRSRCRRLHLSPLSDDDTRAVLQGAGHDTPDALVRLAEGRPGHDLRLSTPQGSAALAAADAVIKSLAKPSAATLSDAIAKATSSDEAFDAFAGRLLRWTAHQAEDQPEYAEHWLALSRRLAEAREDKMDKAQTVAKLVAGLQKAGAAR